MNRAPNPLFPAFSMPFPPQTTRLYPLRKICSTLATDSSPKFVCPLLTIAHNNHIPKLERPVSTQTTSARSLRKAENVFLIDATAGGDRGWEGDIYSNFGFRG